MNQWSCLPKAVSSLLAPQTTFEQLIQAIGHDGSEILNHNMVEPLNRRAFSLGEVASAATRLGEPLMVLDVLEQLPDGREIELFSKEQIRPFLKDCVLYGIVNDQLHAVHCKELWIFDPNGTAYSLGEFKIYSIIFRANHQCIAQLKNICQLPHVVREISATSEST